MSDFLCFSCVTAIAYFISLLVLEYANSKEKKARQILICLVVIVFSFWNGWAMKCNQDVLPLEAVDKEWERYVIYCKQEHISWSDLTFPEWLLVEDSQWDLIEVYE